MSHYKVLVTDYAWEDLSIETEILAKADAEIVLPKGTSESELVDAARGCQAILTNWAQTTSAVIAAADNCRIVSRTGIGLDNIDVEFCTKNGIPVTNVPDYCVTEVAEHSLAMIFSAARKISHYHYQTKSGVYELHSGIELRRMQGQTLGILGMGNIGQYLAKLARGVGLKVIANTRTRKTMDGVTFVDFEELLKESDYLSINVPLTPETREMFSREQFKLMKPTAFLINTARGGVINHSDLADALEAGELAGAALDVQVPEPPDLNQRPYQHPSVIVTPHAAFVSRESLADLRSRSARQVADCLSGKTPQHIVNEIQV